MELARSVDENPFLVPTLLGLGVLVAGGAVLSFLVLTARAPFARAPVAVVSSAAQTSAPVARTAYLEVLASCGAGFDGEPCVNMRSGPGLEFPVLRQLRNGVVLRIASTSITNGMTWYQIGFGGEVHYPERLTDDWYVAAAYVHLFYDEGPVELSAGLTASSTKRIVIDLSREMLTAYDGASVFMQQPISAGLELTPTTLGTYAIYRKLPASYMQGPTPGFSTEYFDLPGVPWVMYFNTNGSAIHGAYWHNRFGERFSHGCINLPPDQAKILYYWAELGTRVTVIP